MRYALPPAYPGEILYGSYARLVRLLGKLPVVEAGSRRVYPRRHLSPLSTCGIPTLVKSLGYPDPSTVARRLLAELSVINYTKAFMSPRGRFDLDGYMNADDAARLARIVTSAFHGTRRKLDSLAHFRFCDACTAEDWESVREPWWHLMHFLPNTVVCTTHARYLRVVVYNDLPLLATPADARLVEAQTVALRARPPEALLRLAELDQAAFFLGGQHANTAEAMISLRRDNDHSAGTFDYPRAMLPLADAMRSHLGEATAHLTALTGRALSQRAVGTVPHDMRQRATSSAVAVQFAFVHGLSAKDFVALALRAIPSAPRAATTVCGARQCRQYVADWSIILSHFVTSEQQFARTVCPDCGFSATRRWGVESSNIRTTGTVTKAVLAELVEFGITLRRDLERVTGLDRRALNRQIRRLPPVLRSRVVPP